MTKKERVERICELYAQGHGRPTILEMVPDTTEWEVRKTIRDIRRGKLDVPQDLVEFAKSRKKRTGIEIVGGLQPLEIKVPRNRKVSNTKHVHKTVAFVGDTHGQFVDERAFDVACQIISDLEPDMLVHLGDLGDFYSISSHERNPNRKQDLQDDLNAAGKLLGMLDQTVSPNTPKILVEGNHEDRLRRYLWNTAPALASLPQLSIPNLLGVESLGWEYVDSLQELMPEFLIKHGSYVSSRGGYTARKEMDRAWMSGISGHTHRLSVHQYTPIRNLLREVRPAVWIENGCLCDIDAEYLKNPGDWQQGFTIVRFDSDGPTPELVPIVHGRAFYNGRSYKG